MPIIILSGANKHTLGGGSEVSAYGRSAAGYAARGRSPYDTRRWVTACVFDWYQNR